MGHRPGPGDCSPRSAPTGARLLAVVAAETSTGVRMTSLRWRARRHRHAAAVDAVTALGGTELRVDDWKDRRTATRPAEVPRRAPGLAPVTAVPRAVEVLRRAPSRSAPSTSTSACCTSTTSGRRTAITPASSTMAYSLHAGLAGCSTRPRCGLGAARPVGGKLQTRWPARLRADRRLRQPAAPADPTRCPRALTRRRRGARCCRVRHRGRRWPRASSRAGPGGSAYGARGQRALGAALLGAVDSPRLTGARGSPADGLCRARPLLPAGRGRGGILVNAGRCERDLAGAVRFGCGRVRAAGVVLPADRDHPVRLAAFRIANFALWPFRAHAGAPRPQHRTSRISSRRCSVWVRHGR